MSKSASPQSKLIQAIRSGRLSSVVAALDEGADIEEADMHGARGLPLRVACFEGHLAIVRELLELGANPNTPAGDGPAGPLRLALRRGHREVLALLLQHGSDIPPGVTIEPDILELGAKAAEPTEGPAPDQSDDFNALAVTDITVDITDSAEDNFGTATRAISADLMFLEEGELKLDPIQPSGRKNRPDPLA